MMEIMKLKKKHSAPTSDTVSEVINKRISTTDSSMQDMEQQLAGSYFIFFIVKISKVNENNEWLGNWINK